MLILIAIAVSIAIGLFVSLLGMVVALQPRRSKGAKGERIVAGRLKDLNEQFYRSFHDLYLPRPDGSGTTQIDHVVVSRFGIFVIETKYYNGWIFGSSRQKMWTQSIYGRNTQFPNPLPQNHLHVLAVAKFLGLPERNVHSLVFFVDGDFRTEMPENVIGSDLCGWIGLRRHVLLSDEAVYTAFMKLEDLDRMTDRKTTRAIHLKELKARRGKPVVGETEADEPQVPAASPGSVPPPLPDSPWNAPNARSAVPESLAISAVVPPVQRVAESF
ncbi:nuclease-related domain-containing protein [Luteolibacter luteus]|uniref:NERD domain-containing protein n=1 Tax=Luteolibacter luteus TaxID=2728835 RepID=A0A858RCL6_9BACT|nr:nuclease-related domain-containing protein [Luteolibacter luteus]QJE94537.1 NERD domain-containing protein [Luteolibacter luteus]